MCMLKFAPSTELHLKKSMGVGFCFGLTSHEWFVPLFAAFAMSGDLQWQSISQKSKSQSVLFYTFLRQVGI